MIQCHKIVHKTKESANEHLRRLKKESNRNKKQINKLGVYACPICNSYHVGTNRFKRKKKIWITL